MGLGGNSNFEELTQDKIQYFTWDDIKTDQRKLLVIDYKIYDVSQFIKKHPGGQRIMSDHLREDATVCLLLFYIFLLVLGLVKIFHFKDAFVAFHNDKPKVAKYMKPLEIGELVHEQRDRMDVIFPCFFLHAFSFLIQTNIIFVKHELVKDFRNLRALAEKMNLFKASPIYFTFVILHILLMELLGWLLIYSNGHSNWNYYLIGAFLLAASQVLQNTIIIRKIEFFELFFN
jgi:hypothetical protein